MSTRSGISKLESGRSFTSLESSLSGKSFLTGKTSKFELRRKFYENLSDFKSKVVLHKEPGFVVYRARCSVSGGVVVLKGYSRETLTLQTRQRICTEVSTLQNAHCPFILKCFDSFEDQGWWWLVLENCAAGSLYDIVQDNGPIWEEGWLVSQVLLPLLQTLTYLHAEGIIHRDVKPEHVLFNSEKVAKLSGFFLSQDTSKFGMPKDIVGTLDYVAPEVFKVTSPEAQKQIRAGKQTGTYDFKVDVWMLGILTYDVLVGRPPFNQEEPNLTVEHILLQDPEFPDEVSDMAADFVLNCLTKDPAERPTAAQLLAHPWIRDNLAWSPPEDFDDIVPDFDIEYYHAALQDDHQDASDSDDEDDVRVKWYNPMTWNFLKPKGTEEFKGEGIRGGVSYSVVSFAKKLLNKEQNLSHNELGEDADFLEKHGIKVLEGAGDDEKPARVSSVLKSYNKVAPEKFVKGVALDEDDEEGDDGVGGKGKGSFKELPFKKSNTGGLTSLQEEEVREDGSSDHWLGKDSSSFNVGSGGAKMESSQEEGGRHSKSGSEGVHKVDMCGLKGDVLGAFMNRLPSVTPREEGQERVGDAIDRAVAAVKGSAAESENQQGGVGEGESQAGVHGQIGDGQGGGREVSQGGAEVQGTQGASTGGSGLAGMPADAADGRPEQAQGSALPSLTGAKNKSSNISSGQGGLSRRMPTGVAPKASPRTLLAPFPMSPRNHLPPFAQGSTPLPPSLPAGAPPRFATAPFSSPRTMAVPPSMTAQHLQQQQAQHQAPGPPPPSVTNMVVPFGEDGTGHAGQAQASAATQGPSASPLKPPPSPPPPPARAPHTPPRANPNHPKVPMLPLGNLASQQQSEQASADAPNLPWASMDTGNRPQSRMAEDLVIESARGERERATGAPAGSDGQGEEALPQPQRVAHMRQQRGGGSNVAAKRQSKEGVMGWGFGLPEDEMDESRVRYPGQTQFDETPTKPATTKGKPSASSPQLQLRVSGNGNQPASAAQLRLGGLASLPRPSSIARLLPSESTGLAGGTASRQLGPAHLPPPSHLNPRYTQPAPATAPAPYGQSIGQLTGTLPQHQSRTDQVDQQSGKSTPDLPDRAITSVASGDSAWNAGSRGAWNSKASSANSTTVARKAAELHEDAGNVQGLSEVVSGQLQDSNVDSSEARLNEVHAFMNPSAPNTSREEGSSSTGNDGAPVSRTNVGKGWI